MCVQFFQRMAVTKILHTHMCVQYFLVNWEWQWHTYSLVLSQWYQGRLNVCMCLAPGRRCHKFSWTDFKVWQLTKKYIMSWLLCGFLPTLWRPGTLMLILFLQPDNHCHTWQSSQALNLLRFYCHSHTTMIEGRKTACNGCYQITTGSGFVVVEIKIAWAWAWTGKPLKSLKLTLKHYGNSI